MFDQIRQCEMAIVAVAIIERNGHARTLIALSNSALSFFKGYQIAIVTEPVHLGLELPLCHRPSV